MHTACLTAKGFSIRRCNMDKAERDFLSPSRQRAVFQAEAQWKEGALFSTFLTLFPNAELSLAAGLFLIF